MPEVHYTYITRSPDGRYYIGVRSCEGDPTEDPYMGSHSDPTYHPSRKRILVTFDSREEAMEHEVYLHRVRDVAINPRYANRVRATSTAFTFPLTPEHIDAMRERNRGANNPMYGRSGELSPQYGRKRTAESKEKMRLSHLGKRGGKLGMTMSKKVRDTISEIVRGRKWFHDPVTGNTTFCFPDLVPPGYLPGRMTVAKNPPELRRVWFHDPVSGREARYISGREPEGYLPGKIRGKKNSIVNTSSD